MAHFNFLRMYYHHCSESRLYDTVYVPRLVRQVLGKTQENAYDLVENETQHPVTVWSGNAKLPKMMSRIKEDMSELEIRSALNWITVVKGNGEMDKCDYMRPGSSILFINLGPTTCELVITFHTDNNVYTQQLEQGDFFELTARVLSESTYIFRPIGPRDQLLYIVFRDTTKE